MLLVMAMLAAAPASAQVFLAARPDPQFTIGPLFVVATVGADPEVTMLNVTWSLTAKAGRAVETGQSLYLLWPAEIAAGTAPGPADAELAPYLGTRGFQVVGDGRLVLRARDRSQIGTTTPGVPLDVVASFVTFTRRGAAAGQGGAASYIKVPWTPKFAEPLSVVTLSMPVKGLILPKAASSFEELFWGRRQVVSVSFADVGSLALPLYPMYFEHRDRVVPLARDFSLLLINFPDADHLRIEDIAPASATRRGSRLRAGTETVSLVLSGGEGLAPQVLRVQFNYFAGRVAWRPIVISLVFLILGNLAGTYMLSRELAGGLRRRLHFGRGTGNADRETGVLLARDTVLALTPGSATRADVLRLFGQPSEERERLPDDRSCTLIYRGSRLTTCRRHALGWVATVSHRELEEHEVVIHVEQDRVRDIEWRINRTRAD